MKAPEGWKPAPISKLNKEVMDARGFHREPCKATTSGTLLVDTYTGFGTLTLPDYEHQWADAEELIDEMRQKGCYIEIRFIPSGIYMCRKIYGGDDTIEFSHVEEEIRDLPKIVCYCYLDWKRKEKIEKPNG
jgi:hypothetical protein